MLQNNVVASAYITILNTSLTKGKSHVYLVNKKNTGPKNVPSGKPVVTYTFSGL